MDSVTSTEDINRQSGSATTFEACNRPRLLSTKAEGTSIVKRRISFCSLVGIILLVLSYSDSYAATFSIPDGNITVLTSAINTSNSNAEDDIVELAINGTYTLTTALP